VRMANLAMSDEVDLELSIPLAALVDEITCPICFSWCAKARMTPCGHNFCAKCLLECLNRQRKCPVCSQDIENGDHDCVDNKHHDRLVEILRVEREKSSKRYFEDLVANGGNFGDNAQQSNSNSGGENASSGGDSAAGKTLSPIEQVFHKHLQKGLLAYESYFESVSSKFKSAIQDAKQASEVRRSQLKPAGSADAGSSGNSDALLAGEEARLEAIIAELEEALERSTALLVESYSGFLESAIPATPQFLPVAVSVEVPSQSLKLPRVVLKPTDSAKDVQALIVEKLAAQGNPVVELTDDCKWVIREPFAAPGGSNNNTDGEGAAAGGKAEEGKDDGQRSVVTVTDLHAPLIQCGLVPGATIVLEGNVRCEDDMPKQCFRQVFVKEETQVVDYYSCRDCKTNWLCKACADSCHADHRTVEYILKHEPSWACCYCFKTKNCQLTPKRARREKK
jgi:Zinc finger, C3HC4 type (RING finger)